MQSGKEGRMKTKEMAKLLVNARGGKKSEKSIAVEDDRTLKLFQTNGDGKRKKGEPRVQRRYVGAELSDFADQKRQPRERIQGQGGEKKGNLRKKKGITGRAREAKRGNKVLRPWEGGNH